jgi:hypothetical protein
MNGGMAEGINFGAVLCKGLSVAIQDKRALSQPGDEENHGP